MDAAAPAPEHAVSSASPDLASRPLARLTATLVGAALVAAVCAVAFSWAMAVIAGGVVLAVGCMPAGAGIVGRHPRGLRLLGFLAVPVAFATAVAAILHSTLPSGAMPF